MQSGKRGAGIGLLLVALLLGVLSRSFVVVLAWHVGVVFNVFSGLQPDALDEGMHMVLLLI